MLGMLRNAPVQFFHMLHGACHEAIQKRIGLRLGTALLGIQGIEVCGDGFFHRLPARIPQIEDLQGPLARPASGGHQFAWRNWRIRLAISMAAMAASKPLLPLLAPARSIACSSVLQVSTPNETGTPLSAAACPMPLTAS